MPSLHLKIITPAKIILEEDVRAVTAPSSEGEITILPHHTHIFSLLVDGIVRIQKEKAEDLLAIGGGYLETDGKDIHILVSRAHRQDELDVTSTQKAIDEAKSLLKNAKGVTEREEAAATLKRSVIDLKLLRRRKRTSL